MVDILQGVFFESASLFQRMSPYLLFGFFFAGLLHIFISLDWIARHLGVRGFYSVVKAVVLGIPLPLCSCGVIPSAVLLRKKGASRGAVISFLIATPITGVDSILATFSLMGAAFTVFRILAASLTAFTAGLVANLLLPRRATVAKTGLDEGKKAPCCDGAPEEGFHVCRGKLAELFHYAFVELLGDIWKWLIVGIIVGGAIAYFVPASVIQRYLGSGWQAMLAMLVVGIPMYVCATGSIPIAAALVLKGMSPGAALVFLLAGPATNAVTITVVSRELGKGAAVIYVITIAAMSVLMGMLLDGIWPGIGGLAPHMHAHAKFVPHWLEIASAMLLASLILIVAVHGFIGGCRRCKEDHD